VEKASSEQNIMSSDFILMTPTADGKTNLSTSFLWCWIRVEISRTDRVRSEVVQRVKEERNILNTIKRRKANWIGQILR
jgi:hypothetical protein